MKMFFGIGVAFSILLAGSVSANSAFPRTTITGVTVHDWGAEILVFLSAPVSNSEGCEINNQLVLRKSHPFFNEIYAGLLSALHAGAPIEGWVNTCHAWKMPVLTRLDIKKG